MAFYIPIELYKTKLYQKAVGYKRFEDLTEERMNEIKELVRKYNERVQEKYKNDIFNNTDLDYYTDLLTYLINPNIHFQLKNFDEKIYFMIQALDPNFDMQKIYLSTEITSNKDINNTEDMELRTQKKALREKQICLLGSRIREKFGFYDAQFLKYETDFFNKYHRNDELAQHVGINLINELLAYSKCIYTFDRITDEQFENIKNIVGIWQSLTEDENDSKTCAYNTMMQTSLLGLKNIHEQLVFFITAIDPELEMLQIFEEESRMPITIERAIERFGFYNEELIKLEKKYLKRFYPDKKVSIWSL